MEKRRSLEERLAEHPKLRAQFEELLELVENEGEVVLRADQAEELVDRQVRRIGQEVLQEWAERQATRQERTWDARVGVTRKEKKVSGG
jgi:hypothetical protein